MLGIQTADADASKQEGLVRARLHAFVVDMKFEIVVVPVSDVEHAKEFYAKLGWRLDADYDNGKDFRIIQFTPPGSGRSVIFGKNVNPAAPGSAQGLYLDRLRHPDRPQRAGATLVSIPRTAFVLLAASRVVSFSCLHATCALLLSMVHNG